MFILIVSIWMLKYLCACTLRCCFVYVLHRETKKLSSYCDSHADCLVNEHCSHVRHICDSCELYCQDRSSLDCEKNCPNFFLSGITTVPSTIPGTEESFSLSTTQQTASTSSVWMLFVCLTLLCCLAIVICKILILLNKKMRNNPQGSLLRMVMRKAHQSINRRPNNQLMPCAASFLHTDNVQARSFSQMSNSTLLPQSTASEVVANEPVEEAKFLLQNQRRQIRCTSSVKLSQSNQTEEGSKGTSIGRHISKERVKPKDHDKIEAHGKATASRCSKNDVRSSDTEICLSRAARQSDGKDCGTAPSKLNCDLKELEKSPVGNKATKGGRISESTNEYCDTPRVAKPAETAERTPTGERTLTPKSNEEPMEGGGGTEDVEVIYRRHQQEPRPNSTLFYEFDMFAPQFVQKKAPSTDMAQSSPKESHPVAVNGIVGGGEGGARRASLTTLEEWTEAHMAERGVSASAPGLLVPYQPRSDERDQLSYNAQAESVRPDVTKETGRVGRMVHGEVGLVDRSRDSQHEFESQGETLLKERVPNTLEHQHPHLENAEAHNLLSINTDHLDTKDNQYEASRGADGGQDPPKQRNKRIYDQLRKIDWVMGYYSATGESIEVYVNLGSLDPHAVEQQLADITGADITKFHAKQTEPESEYEL